MPTTPHNSPKDRPDRNNKGVFASPASHSQREQKSVPAIANLVDADAIGAPLGVTGRTVLNWAEAKKIPTALRLGRIVRFDPQAVATALGIRTFE